MQQLTNQEARHLLDAQRPGEDRCESGASPPAAVLEAIARRFHERQLEEPPERVAKLIHEDAEMALVINDFRPVRGRDRIIASLADARHQMIYSAEIERCEALDSTTLLLRGQARYAVERGLSHSTVYWLDGFRDQLLWRVTAFRKEAEARAAYEAG
ncbi:MAG: hypothetical protein ACM3QU_00340 [Verrucomicrobiota bacterium]